MIPYSGKRVIGSIELSRRGGEDHQISKKFGRVQPGPVVGHSLETSLGYTGRELMSFLAKVAQGGSAPGHPLHSAAQSRDVFIKSRWSSLYYSLLFFCSFPLSLLLLFVFFFLPWHSSPLLLTLRSHN